MVFNLFKKKKTKEDIKDKSIDLVNSRFPDETCALCSYKGCEKKWGGQYWHKKCLKTMKSTAKSLR